jgi:hypothetical protein
MQKTIIDIRKEEAQILLIAITGSTYTIRVKSDDVHLGSKRGIKKDYQNGLVDVTETKWDWLQQQYQWATDF